MRGDREFVATVTSKGQVTIPAEVREQLGLSPQDKVIFRLGEGNRVEIELLSIPGETSVEDDPLWGVVGLGSSGLGNLSIEHDHYLAESEDTDGRQNGA